MIEYVSPQFNLVRQEDCADALIQHLENPIFATINRHDLAEALPQTGDLFVIVTHPFKLSFRNLARETLPSLRKGIDKIPEYWVGNSLATWAVYSGKAHAWKRFATEQNSTKEDGEYHIISPFAPLYAHLAGSFRRELREIRDRGQNMEFVRQRLESYLKRQIRTPGDLRDAIVRLIEVEVPEPAKLELQTRIYRELPFKSSASLSMFNDVDLQEQIRLALGWIAQALNLSFERDYTFETEVRVLSKLTKHTGA